MKLIFYYFILLLNLTGKSIQGIIITASCYGICTGVCLSMGPYGFARTVGIQYDIQGCVQLCMRVCSNGLAIPGHCFDEDTKVLVKDSSNEFSTTSIKNLRQGDIVLTTDWINKKGKETRVASIKLIQIKSIFVEITFQSQVDITSNNDGSIGKLEVTEDHIMIVKSDISNDILKLNASKLKLGDMLLGLNQEHRIIGLAFKSKSVKVQISTEEGTILANDALASCDCITLKINELNE